MSQELIEKADRVGSLLAPNLALDWPNLPVVRAAGAHVWGADGRRYLDFVSGMGSANVGHGHPLVVEAAKRQIDQMIHGAVGVVLYDSILDLAEQLREVTPGDLNMFFFGNSGAEAVEGALKLARYATGRPAIIAFQGGFHGRTMGAASVTTSNSKYRLRYEPLLPSVYFAPYPYCYRCPLGWEKDSCSMQCIDALERLFHHVAHPTQVAAVLLEPVLGEGGYVVPPEGYLQRVREMCDRYGILLILDEVQTGFGRTGGYFAAQVFGVTPDIMAVAKGIASGFPLGATVAPEHLMKRWAAGSHGTTFGGNPVSCAAALATLDVLRREGLPERAARLGERAKSRLRESVGSHPHVGDIRGQGLMIGIELIEPETGSPDGETAARVLREALNRGLILYPCGTDGHCIRVLPSLAISEEDLDSGLDILQASIGAVVGD